MARFIGVLIGSSVALLAFVFAFLMLQSPPSTSDLDKDLTEVQQKIDLTREESAKYAGGVVKSLIDMRLSILALTKEILEQKRHSLLRRVDLRFTVGGQPAAYASAEELARIEADIAAAERKAADARSEASRYTGGLVQSMALLKASTEEATVSMLRMRYYAAKHGLPINLPPIGSDGVPAAPAPAGKVVKDKEAL